MKETRLTRPITIFSMEKRKKYSTYVLTLHTIFTHTQRKSYVQFYFFQSIKDRFLLEK